MNTEISENARRILEQKYLLKDDQGEVVETPEEMFWRVANFVAEAEEEAQKEWSQKFFDIMSSWLFIPGGRTLAAAGTEHPQLANCFVLPIEDNIESIFDTERDMAIVQKHGGGTGFSFSRIRPEGTIVGGAVGVASGPLSFMNSYNAATGVINQGGYRRGANIAILRVDHPDIEKFISCKHKEGELSNFNVSVGITDKFMEALKNGDKFELIDPHTSEAVGKIAAKKIMDEIVEGSWLNGDPGVVFLDTVNKDNPTPGLGRIEATNPCGEQPLLPYEACNLGSLNLGNFVQDGEIDIAKLKIVTEIAIRFLDNVIDVGWQPLPQIEEMVKGNRKVGLGVMGWGDALIKMSIPYNSQEGLDKAEEVMKCINESALEISRRLAEEKGTFSNLDKSIFKDDERPPRNAAVTTVAPTGSTSMIADASSGIEPIYALSFNKIIKGGQEKVEYIYPPLTQVLQERGIYSEELAKKIKEGSIQAIESIPEDIKRIFVGAHDVSPEYHVRMQAAFQKYVGASISKTINLSNNATREQIRDAYLLAYKLDCKGVTVYRDGSRDKQILESGEQEKKQIEPIEPKERPRKLPSWGTVRVKTGCGSLFVTINEDHEGNPFEVFVTLGKAGVCASAQTQALGRSVSLMLRSGIGLEYIIDQYQGIHCEAPAGIGENKVASCADGVAKVLREYIEDKQGGSSPNPNPNPDPDPYSVKTKGACPLCGSSLIFQEGCIKCSSCSYSECG